VRRVHASNSCRRSVTIAEVVSALFNRANAATTLPVATLIVDLDPDLDLTAQSKALERLVKESEKRLKAK